MIGYIKTDTFKLIVECLLIESYFTKTARAHPWFQLNIVACPRKSTYGSGLLLLYFFFSFFIAPQFHSWYFF